MTITDLFIAIRRGRELTPYQKWCLEEIEKKGNIQIVIENGTATICKKNEEVEDD